MDTPSTEVTAQGAAARVGVHARTVRRAIARGELPAIKRHGVFHIALAELAAWHTRRIAGPTGTPVVNGLLRAPSLPRPLTALVGRDRELATATRMLRRDDVRLLTLTGAGGIGKTRLGLAVADQLRADYADGVCFVPLAEVPEASLVAPAIAAQLRLPEHGANDVAGALLAALRDAQTLLFLDNLEHVMAAVPLVAELLKACPRLDVMVTSRSLLRIGGEHALPVPPLDLPDRETNPMIDQVMGSPALQLFSDRARAVAPAFTITPETAPAVTAICHRLGGIPLAIELAASQVTVLPPDVLLARIEAHLPLPVDGPRDAPDRQRTMGNAIAWSYELLSAHEQWVFRRLGLFVGGFSLDAVESVSVPAQDGCPDDALIVLAALVDASLVQRARDAAGRFTMLEPIRTFALERLRAEGEVDATCDALANWCLALVEQTPMAASIPGGQHHLSRLEAEHAPLWRALEWLYAQHDANRLIRLAVALGGYWYERNHYREGQFWTERALGAAVHADPALRARAAVQLGLFRSILGDTAGARAIAADGVAALRQGMDSGALALALIWSGAIALQEGTYEQAQCAFDEARQVAAEIPDQSLAAALTARAMSNLGVIAHDRGHLDDAVTWHASALAICREHGYLLGMVRSHCDLADVARDRGDHATALRSYRAAVSMLGERGDLRVVVATLEGAALGAVSWSQGEVAARLLGAAAGVGERYGVPLLMRTDRSAHDRAMRAAQETVGRRRFDLLFAEGHRLTLTEAIAEVLAVSPLAGSGSPSPTPGRSLSPRERDVLRLLATGLRDREIAEALFISARTVQGHVARILAKLDVPTRVAAARAAIDLGLLDDVP